MSKEGTLTLTLCGSCGHRHRVAGVCKYDWCRCFPFKRQIRRIKNESGTLMDPKEIRMVFQEAGDAVRAFGVACAEFKARELYRARWPDQVSLQPSPFPSCELPRIGMW